MRQRVVSRILLSFLAGALGVLAFHQGFLLLAYALSRVPAPPYSLAGTPPLGIPKVLSLAFWGGVWGIVMIPALGRLGAKSRPLAAVLFGGVLPTLVAVLVVVPLKGLPVAESLQPRRLLFGFVINGLWGLGTVLFYRALNRRGWP